MHFVESIIHTRILILVFMYSVNSLYMPLSFFGDLMNGNAIGNKIWHFQVASFDYSEMQL